MSELSGILSKFDEVEVFIIRIAGLGGIIFICLKVLRGHYKGFTRRPRGNRSKTNKPSRKSDN